MMKLYFKQEYIGNISDIHMEGLWINGTLAKNESANRFSNFFEYMVDEEKGLEEEPPFSDDLLDENNWYLIDESGNKLDIDIPAVHENEFITWRWR